ncbi:MAG: signal peptidase I [Polyangia bacterium]
MAFNAYTAWSQRRRITRDGNLLVLEARRGLRRYGSRLEPSSRQAVDAAATKFEAETKSGTVDELLDALNALDKALDDYLSFSRKSTARQYIEAVGTAVLIALFLRAFVVEAFKIPSGSMIPTLQVGDHIFVNKFIYGIRVPFTNIKIGESVRAPHRGEVIVFIYPKDPDKDFIKRIVATAGDIVQMRDGVLYVNNEAVPHQLVEGDCVYDDYDETTDQWEKRDCEITRETVRGIEYTTYHNPGLDTPGPPHNTTPFTVPPHSVYVLGDNRDNSHDSRWWHEVPEDNIKGKAMIIWWSQGNPDAVPPGGPLSFLRNVPILKVFYGGRYGRIFSLVN